jgi:hypothetical protein
MRPIVALAVAGLAFTGARAARTVAEGRQTKEAASEPYAPSPAAAPYMSLGYREAIADALFVRLRGYFGDVHNTADGLAALCEAIVELDPRFGRIYDYCGNAMTLVVKHDIPQSIYHRALALVARGMDEFPNDWRLPNLAAQIYTQDLKTDDPKQRREWDEKATMLVESAIRKPGAPANLADWAAVMRTRFGQHERAVQGLRELILTTEDLSARKMLLERLAELEEENADAIAGELLEARNKFESVWKAERPAVPATWYVLLGPRLAPGFDMTTLATGGHDLVTSAGPEKLAPVE